jgi:hypothetical protein
MIDAIIALLLGYLSIEMARLGGTISVNPPSPDNPNLAKRYKNRFQLYALIACGLLAVQCVRTYSASNEAARVQSGLNGSIKDLNAQVIKSENGRQVDNAYLKAKLEDYKELQALAPALLKMAQATEGFTQKQYEGAVLSKKQLLDLTEKTVAKIRKLGESCNATENSIMRSNLEYPSNFRSIDNNRQHCIATYREQILGDAASLRKELLSRIGGDAPSTAGASIKDMAIDGFFAGPDPIDDSADYLEALANEYRKKAPQEPGVTRP